MLGWWVGGRGGGVCVSVQLLVRREGDQVRVDVHACGGGSGYDGKFAGA